MSTTKFAPGDIVFAKIKGFAAWPAKVEYFETISSTQKVKYHVYFYGTNQVGECKEEDLFPYIENREKYGKPKKLVGFMKSLSQADSELGIQRHKTTENVNQEEVPNLTHFDFLKAELLVLKIDLGIKNSLNVDKPKLSECLRLLNDYSETMITPLMFKKNPQLIDTLLKLQVYARNVRGRNSVLNEKSKAKEEYKIQQIRKLARNIYYRIQSIFTVPQGKTFLELFAEELNQFQEAVKTLSENEVLQMSNDPTTK